mgnify:CR=1 FL=1
MIDGDLRAEMEKSDDVTIAAMEGLSKSTAKGDTIVIAMALTAIAGQLRNANLIALATHEK